MCAIHFINHHDGNQDEKVMKMMMIMYLTGAYFPQNHDDHDADDGEEEGVVVLLFRQGGCLSYVGWLLFTMCPPYYTIIVLSHFLCRVGLGLLVCKQDRG